MISRRRLIGLLAAGLALHSHSPGSKAQEAKTFRVGALLPGPESSFKEGLLIPLRDLGYVEGKNLIFEYRSVVPQDLSAAARDLVQMKVDVIWAHASSGVRAAVDATNNIPIVAVDLESDPVASGYASSLARPGRNVTGFFLDPGFSAERLEVLKEALPSLSAVTLLWDPTLNRAPVKAISAAASNLKLRLIIVDVHSEHDIETAFKAVNRKSDAIMMMQSPALNSYGVRIAKLGQKYRVPVMALFPVFAAHGALLSYGPNATDMIAESASYIDRILKGAKPGELPIQRADKFDLAVNLKTADALGLTIGPSLLQRADHVFH